MTKRSSSATRTDSRLTIDKDGHILIEHKDGMKIEIAADHTITITADTIKLDGAVQITGAPRSTAH